MISMENDPIMLRCVIEVSVFALLIVSVVREWWRGREKMRERRRK